MPKLLLKFQAAVIKEISLDKTPLTIGRKPDNDVVIDSMSVSGHHARIILQGNSYMIEDLQSTNGTFLNEKKILNGALKHDDQVLLGQHTLVFVNPEETKPETPEAPPAAPANPDATVVIVPQKPAAPAPGIPPAGELPAKYPAKTEKTGILRVIEGKAEQGEYILTGPLTYIGKSESAAIKIKGLFAPDIAALISKRPTGYLISAIKEGYPKVNNISLAGQQELSDGDLIETGSLKLLFQLKEKKPE
ncbi:MAG: FHA domain-containing protein [Endomicrobiales bacterium]